jgi:hypothetical protein
MRILRRSFCTTMLLAQALAAAGLHAEPAQDEGMGRFLRLRLEDKTPLALEAAVVQHVPLDCGQTGPTVDLVAAVHVAEPGYYTKLNRLFRDYDAVLYELVAPEGTRVPKGGPKGGASPVSAIQTGMTAFLNLQFQLEGIDYTPPNLVHADMSPDQFARSMRERGESMFEMFMRMVGYAMSRQQEAATGASDARLLLGLLSEDRALAMKRVLAEQFAEMDGSLIVINGPNGSTLITERNKVALDVLKKQIAAGKQKMAIFYGAGHMPDFQQRLRDELGLVPISTQWLVAWDLKGRPLRRADQ